MAIRPIICPQDFVCSSADTKPTEDIGVGSTIIENDTTDVYMFDGEYWFKMT